ncbi:mercury resistance system transport protein MerF [Marinobacter subterrani]
MVTPPLPRPQRRLRRGNEESEEPAQGRLLRVGIVGTILVALCCFTPILVILMATVGLAALTGYLDYVLLPALAVFIGLTVYAFWRKKHYDASYESNFKAPRSFPSEK